jgi:hypothetical protein
MATLGDFRKLKFMNPAAGIFIVAGTDSYIVKFISDNNLGKRLLVFGRSSRVNSVLLDCDDPKFASTTLYVKTSPIPDWEQTKISREICRALDISPDKITYLKGRAVASA